MDFEMEKTNYNPLLLVPKSDLKAARLVCKEWRVLASALLFETVYISANQEDLDVFQGIAGSEELRVSGVFLATMTAIVFHRLKMLRHSRGRLVPCRGGES